MKKLLVLAIALATASMATADIRIGGPRNAGLGGAGLALPFRPTQNAILNPSFFALSKGFNFAWPGFGARVNGISISDAADYLRDLSNGSISDTDLDRLARQFGDGRVEFGANADFAFSIGNFGFIADGAADAVSVPNQTLINWTNAGAVGNPTVGSQLDAYGVGAYSFRFGYGHKQAIKGGDFSYGATLNLVEARYAHKIAAYTGGASATVSNGLDIPGNDDMTSDRGVGVDLGFLYQPQFDRKLSFGLTVNNFVQPNVRFNRQLPNSAVVLRDDINLFRTRYNFGAGYLLNDRVMLAADVLDFGNRSGLSGLVVGGSVNIAKGVDFTIGYNTRTAFSYGFSFGGFNIQVGGQQPLTIGTGFKF